MELVHLLVAFTAVRALKTQLFPPAVHGPASPPETTVLTLVLLPASA